MLLAVVACGGEPEGPVRSGAQPASNRAPLPSGPTSQASRIVASDSRITNAEVSDPIAELAREVKALRQEVESLRLVVAHIPGAGQAAQAETLSRLRRDPEARAEAQRAEEQRVAESESAFRAEPQDARWSESATATVRTALSQASPTLLSAVRSVECRSQSCRIEINDDAVPDLAEKIPLLMMQTGGVLPNLAASEIDQGNGQTATVLYLSRALAGPPPRR